MIFSDRTFESLFLIGAVIASLTVWGLLILVRREIERMGALVKRAQAIVQEFPRAQSQPAAPSPGGQPEQHVFLPTMAVWEDDFLLATLTAQKRCCNLATATERVCVECAHTPTCPNLPSPCVAVGRYNVAKGEKEWPTEPTLVGQLGNSSTS